MKRQDFVAWEGPSSIDGSPVAVIVTGVSRPSANVKTGPMLQVWIIRSDMHPKQAVLDGADVAVCGTCALRGTGDGSLRSCYVRVETGPSAVWRKYTQGGYPLIPELQYMHLVAGRDVRVGAYGDPTAAPYEVIHSLTRYSRMWTGYSHRWSEVDQKWSRLLMASVESDEQAQRALGMGWRPFLALPKGEPVPEHAFLCPAEREDRLVQCAQCGACAGSKDDTRALSAVYPYVPMHGRGWKNYLRLQQQSV